MKTKTPKMFHVYCFSISGLLSACLAWPLLNSIGFLVAGILLNVLAIALYRVVRTHHAAKKPPAIAE